MDREAIAPARFAKAGGPVAVSPDGVACRAFLRNRFPAWRFGRAMAFHAGGGTRPCTGSLKGKRPEPESACVRICLRSGGMAETACSLATGRYRLACVPVCILPVNAVGDFPMSAGKPSFVFSVREIPADRMFRTGFDAIGLCRADGGTVRPVSCRRGRFSGGRIPVFGRCLWGRP